jgi:hypothetical protein
MVGFFQELEFGLEALQEEILHSPALIAMWSAKPSPQFSVHT